MGFFKGTIKEFKRYIGPYLRNVVQHITRKQKAAIGACERCGADGDLDAAHVHGRDRTDIINLLLGTSEIGTPVEKDLKEFEHAFRREHEPVEKAILVLCKSCHRKYDAAANRSGANHPARVRAAAPGPRVYSSSDFLPISLDPPRPKDFKTQLLERRKAVIEVLYEDGTVDRRPWNALRFHETSNVFGNLRSRPEFRQGAWQSNGIVKLNVRVAE